MWCLCLKLLSTNHFLWRCLFHSCSHWPFDFWLYNGTAPLKTSASPWHLPWHFHCVFSHQPLFCDVSSLLFPEKIPVGSTVVMNRVWTAVHCSQQLVCKSTENYSSEHDLIFHYPLTPFSPKNVLNFAQFNTSYILQKICLNSFLGLEKDMLKKRKIYSQ